jgi:hypothetical protein
MLLLYIRIPKTIHFFFTFAHILLSPLLDVHKSTYFTKLKKKKSCTWTSHLIDYQEVVFLKNNFHHFGLG